MLITPTRTPKWTLLLIVPATLALGATSHLALDAIPHYNWIVYLNWFHGLPFHWLIRDAVLSIPVVIIALYCGRDYLILVCLALFGSMYPDFEKVAYGDFHIPESLVIFRSHSLQLSANTGGLSHWLLITIEITVLALLLTATAIVSQRRMRSKPA